MATTPTPLEHTDMGVMLNLGHVLWSWPLCGSCVSRRPCTDNECSARVLQVKRYYQFYRALIDTYVDESFEATRVFTSHEDLFQAIQTLRYDPHMTRLQLAESITGLQSSSLDSVSAAICLTVKVLTMIDSSSSRLFSCSSRPELGCWRTPWMDYVRFSDYIHDMFPKRDRPGFGGPGSDRFSDIKAALRATQLMKNLRVTLRPTHDLRDHLRFDRKNRILDVFHLTTFLKEQLKLTRNTPHKLSASAVTPSMESNAYAVPRPRTFLILLSTTLTNARDSKRHPSAPTTPRNPSVDSANTLSPL